MLGEENIQYEKDNKFNYNLFSSLRFHGDHEKIDFILEAGNLEINNTGTLLTSSSCFNRNLSQSRV